MVDGGWWLSVDAEVRVSGQPVLQVAADSAWEVALVADGKDARGAPDLVARAVAAGRRDVAIEVLWPRQGFAGARWLLEDAAEAAAAAERVASFMTHAAVSGQPLADALVAVLAAPPGRDVDRVELGAVNAWASVGAQVLWQRGRPDAGLPLADLPGRRPDLFECQHPVALEVAASEPRVCWVGVVVSTPHGQLHRTDLTRVGQLYDRATAAPAEEPTGTPAGPPP
ncbi:hypothetical protein [Pseudonocardia sp. TRM90224]|uniref:hypothetical protein n=1 Tax=Pseudonocardia sp. TRM90224 TaxID=2812678 RepID=UPI001E52581E|nr:hypothetical protein [Pseudonocardia sp. TRM90224]